MQLCSAVMRIALLLALILAMPALAGQVVWKWVDSQGVTHYSDRPVPGAQRIELHGSGASASTTTPAPASPPTTISRSAGSAPAYRLLEISKPAPDETLINVEGSVEVEVNVQPELQSDHSLDLYLDGQPVSGFPPGTQSFVLKDVFRGTHQVTATITDQDGRQLAQSQPVTFHVRQTSVLNPQNGQPRTPR